MGKDRAIQRQGGSEVRPKANGFLYLGQAEDAGAQQEKLTGESG